MSHNEESPEVVTDPQGHPVNVPAQPALLGASVEDVARELLAHNPEMMDDEAKRLALQRFGAERLSMPDPELDNLREIAQKSEKVMHLVRHMRALLDQDLDEHARYHAWDELRGMARRAVAEWGAL